MGDDERDEFLYKFISDGRVTKNGDNSALLDAGRIFAAKCIMTDVMTGWN